MAFLPVSIDSVGDVIACVIADTSLHAGFYHIIEHSMAVAK